MENIVFTRGEFEHSCSLSDIDPARIFLDLHLYNSSLLSSDNVVNEARLYPDEDILSISGVVIKADTGLMQVMAYLAKSARCRDLFAMLENIRSLHQDYVYITREERRELVSSPYMANVINAETIKWDGIMWYNVTSFLIIPDHKTTHLNGASIQVMNAVFHIQCVQPYILDACLLEEIILDNNVFDGEVTLIDNANDTQEGCEITFVNPRKARFIFHMIISCINKHIISNRTHKGVSYCYR